MKNLILEVDDGEKAVSTNIAVTDEDSVDTIAQKISTELGIDFEEIIESIGDELAGNIGGDKDNKIKIRRVCIDLYFEAKKEEHQFSSKSKWSKVHRWGCQRFNIARDACANLELRDGKPDGPALNENKAIGSFKGCRAVWMVKPGAEPNGGR